MPELKDPKTMGAGVAVLGIMGMAAMGYVNIVTPEAQQCAVDLADAKARLELIAEAKNSLEAATATCKDALKSCSGS
jgi:hypothetical protein